MTLITLFDRVAPYTDFTLEGPNLRRMMREKGIASASATLGRAGGDGSERGAPALRHLSRRLEAHRQRRSRRASPPCWERDRRVSLRYRRPVHRAATPKIASIAICARARRNGHRPGSAASTGPATASPRATSPMSYSMAIAWAAKSRPDPQRPRAIIREQRIWGSETWPKLGDPGVVTGL